MSQKNKKIINVFSPIDQEIVKSIPISPSIKIESIINKAKKAAVGYNFSSLKYRKKIMYKFRNEIVKNSDALVQIICKENGKKEVEGLMEVFIVLEHITESIKILCKALEKNIRSVGILKSRRAWVEYEPMGVVGIISLKSISLFGIICKIVKYI